MGDDGGVRPEWEHGGLRGHGQHAHHLRPQQQGQPGHRQDDQGGGRIRGKKKHFHHPIATAQTAEADSLNYGNGKNIELHDTVKLRQL